MSDLIYGLNSLFGALKNPGALSEIWLDEKRRDKRLGRLAEQAKKAGLTVQWVAREELDRLSDNARHQGAVARLAAEAAAVRNESFLEQLLTELDSPPLLLVLDGVQDPHNLGACLRTADAVGAHAVIAPRDRACGLTPTVRKVASGAAESVPFIQVTNLSRTLKMLRHAGVWVVGTAMDESAGPLYQARLDGPLALVLGAEGSGIRRLSRENCDQLVTIPMLGTVESLNVSVAAGVCLYEARRQRDA